jgi:hypothetical protein
VRLPVIVAGGHVHVGSVNENVFDPPVNVTVIVIVIGVPHTKLAEVLTEKGTRFVAMPLTGMFG